MYNDGQWTKARFDNFIKGVLRNASLRWPPRINVKKAARVDRGQYLCAGYNRDSHVVPVTLVGPNYKRIDNALVDHVVPVIPDGGFINWDSVIERMFCNSDNLQVLCHECHKLKTADERIRRSSNKTL